MCRERPSAGTQLAQDLGAGSAGPDRERLRGLRRRPHGRRAELAGCDEILERDDAVARPHRPDLGRGHSVNGDQEAFTGSDLADGLAGLISQLPDGDPLSSRDCSTWTTSRGPEPALGRRARPARASAAPAVLRRGRGNPRPVPMTAPPLTDADPSSERAVRRPPRDRERRLVRRRHAGLAVVVNPELVGHGAAAGEALGPVVAGRAGCGRGRRVEGP